MDKEIETIAKQFLDEQFGIMKKYGSEPKLSNEQYQDVLTETEKIFRTLTNPEQAVLSATVETARV